MLLRQWTFLLSDKSVSMSSDDEQAMISVDETDACLLHAAGRAGDMNTVRELIDKDGVDVNQLQYDGTTPLLQKRVGTK